jgi:2,5-dihydroxypyridine 5,6-dioxygenase
MSTSAAEITSLFRKELEFCRVNEKETVALFTEPRFDQSYSAAFVAASKDLGADVFTLLIPSLREPNLSFPGKAVTESLKQADLVVDMTMLPGPGFHSLSPFLYTDASNEILASGSRILMVNHAVDVLRRLLPDQRIAKRCRAGAEFLEKAETIRLTSAAGTDLALNKKGRPSNCQRGYVDEPGQWDHWPSAQVGCAPLEDSSNGTLVLDTGDWVVNFRMIRDPVTIRIKNGRAIDIQGGSDAMELREWFRLWNDEWAYGVSHIGWGCEDRAIWGASVMDIESYYANTLIAFGSNFFKGPAKYCGLGGKNRSLAHLDIGLRNCDFYADGKLITSKGNIVPDALK